MSFTINNYSSNAVITDIGTPTSSQGELTVTGGTFPLFSGGSVGGTNTTISDSFGSPFGTIQLFLQQGDAQLEIYINGSLYSAKSYSSGIVEIQVPILFSSDIIGITVDEADLPSPSPTPSVTPSPTVTPTGSPTQTPTNTQTPTPTQTPSPS